MTSTSWEAAARAAASSPNVVLLCALRLHEEVLLGRRELEEYGNVCDETWAELDRRAEALVNALPEETPHERGKTLRGGPLRTVAASVGAEADDVVEELSRGVSLASRTESPVSSDSGLKYHSVVVEGPAS